MYIHGSKLNSYLFLLNFVEDHELALSRDIIDCSLSWKRFLSIGLCEIP